MLYFQKSYDYTKLVGEELTELFSKSFSKDKETICLLATGGFGKHQLTPNSDIDLICLIDSKIADMDDYKREIRNSLIKIKYRHSFEIYPIESVEGWKWVAKYSTLYASDLFFAIKLWGNELLFLELMNWINEHKIEESNKISHFIYNYLYRRQQLQNPRIDESLKYQKGGLRDFQFIKWVTWRIFNITSYSPEIYLVPLYEKAWLTRSEYELLLVYTEAILEYKWLIKESKAPEANNYPELRNHIDKVVNKLKNKTFEYLSSSKNKNWQKNIILYLHNLQEKPSFLDPDVENDESILLCEAWYASTIEQLDSLLESGQDYWSVRAALALNKNATKKFLKNLYKLNYPDMDDIKDFIIKNPKYV